MKILNWARYKTLRDLNNEALERTRVDLAYARLTLGRAKMDVELLEAREQYLEHHAEELKTGDLIGHPSCEGGLALGAHVHVARKHNGEWLNAAGDLAFTIAGWRPVEGVEEYDGGLVRGGESREACECKEAEKNGLTAGQ